MLTTNIYPETAVPLIVGIGSSILAVLLMLIKIPQSDYNSKLVNSKLAIVVSFLICSFMMMYAISVYGNPTIPDWDMFLMLTIYIVVHFSTSIISYSMIALLKTERHRRQNLFVPGLFVSGIIAFMLLESYRSGNMTYFWSVCIVALAAFLIQSITYIIYFDKAYKRVLKELEEYYDEDEEHKIKWVRFCYIISMLTNLFILVYLLLYWFLDYKMEVASLYTLWYLVYMLYLTANFISFLGSHRLVLDAFAHKMFTVNIRPKKAVQRISRKESAAKNNIDKEFSKLDVELKRWVDNKLYCEYDKTREKVVSELHTTKEILNLYFAQKVGVDFRTWRTNLRIEEAKRLLLENKDLSVNIIAEMSGFSDKSNFHRQFTKLVGCSPRQWRESEENQTNHK